jgi:nucleoid DNA-binding protein
MNFIVGKQPLDAGRSEMIDLISGKTGLKSQDVVLMMDAFSFFIRKKTIEQGCACVTGIGKFYVKPHDYSLYGRKYHTIDFFPSDDFKERVKGTRHDMIVYTAPFIEQLKVFSKMFGLKHVDAKYLFRLYLSSISSILRKYNEFRIPRLGTFKLKFEPRFLNLGIAKKWNYDKTIILIDFKLADPFFREVNKQVSQYNVYERLKQMLYLVGQSRDISRKEYNKDHDYKKDKGY